MIDKLSDGMHCSESYFNENMVEEHITTVEADEPIDRWDDKDHHQLYHEALNSMGYNFDDVEGMCLKSEQLIMQKGIKKHGDKGKMPAMKEMHNLATKNDCFGELECDSLTKEMKRKALPLLMFMTAKRNGEIKSRGVVNGSFQKIHASKEECSSPTLDFYVFKHVCAVIAHEMRDAWTVDLPGFFL